jgi:hypothetical protein
VSRPPTRRLVVVLGIATTQVLGATVPAQAAPSAAQRLVHAYSPIVLLRAQEDPPCNTSQEQYQPTTVDVVLGNPRVQLVRIRKRVRRVITNAPTATQIAGLGKDYYLDLPGDTIDSECVHARDFYAIMRSGRAPPITYARIATEKGFRGFVVQYWFFYYFNQFNDLHEGDWEGMQIAFDASTAAQALAEGPSKVVLFQHAGGETASWDDDKLQKHGSHPVVYSAAGSHATFYGSGVYLQTGQGGAGLGCDNTTGPWRRVAVRPELVPTYPVRRGPFPWLRYKGHWGQKESGFNNGPAGPNTKVVWREPFTWMDGARLASPRLPAGGFLGPPATQAFCGVVATVSQFINAQSRSPRGVLLLVAILALLVVLPIVVTRWWPVDLTKLRQPRAFGQLVRAARQLYGRHWRTFVPIALSAIPIVAAIEGVQALYTEVAGQRSLTPAISIGGSQLGLSITISGTLRPLGFAIVTGAAIAAMRLLDSGERPSFTGAWRLALRRFWRLVFARLLATLMVFLLVVTVIGVPFAIWKYFEWQLIQQEILFEDKPIRAAFRGSSKLVRGHWWHTVRITGFLSLLAIVVGPVLGFVLIFANFSLVAVEVVSSVVYALLLPYEAIGRTLLYFDLVARKEAEAQSATPRKRGLRRLSRTRPSPQPG